MADYEAMVARLPVYLQLLLANAPKGYLRTLEDLRLAVIAESRETEGDCAFFFREDVHYAGSLCDLPDECVGNEFSRRLVARLAERVPKATISMLEILTRLTIRPGLLSKGGSS